MVGDFTCCNIHRLPLKVSPVSDYLQAHEYFEQPHAEHPNCCIGCRQSPTCLSGRFSVCSLFIRSKTRVESITSCNSKSANIRTSLGSLYCHPSTKNIESQAQLSLQDGDLSFEEEFSGTPKNSDG